MDAEWEKVTQIVTPEEAGHAATGFFSLARMLP
jgi:hypothetical protein